jgi:hypothetical protein
VLVKGQSKDASIPLGAALVYLDIVSVVSAFRPDSAGWASSERSRLDHPTIDYSHGRNTGLVAIGFAAAGSGAGGAAAIGDGLRSSLLRTNRWQNSSPSIVSRKTFTSTLVGR